MTVVNRRNAVVGWVALKGGKAIARRKMKSVGRRLVSRQDGSKPRGKAKQSA
jgi:hypothetical protein